MSQQFDHQYRRSPGPASARQVVDAPCRIDVYLTAVRVLVYAIARQLTQIPDVEIAGELARQEPQHAPDRARVNEPVTDRHLPRGRSCGLVRFDSNRVRAPAVLADALPQVRAAIPTVVADAQALAHAGERFPRIAVVVPGQRQGPAYETERPFLTDVREERIRLQPDQNVVQQEAVEMIGHAAQSWSSRLPAAA